MLNSHEFSKSWLEKAYTFVELHPKPSKLEVRVKILES